MTWASDACLDSMGEKNSDEMRTVTYMSLSHIAARVNM